MIRIPADVEAAIRRHGRAAYPEECCGALLGRGGESGAGVVEAEPVANARRARRERRFRIEADDYRRLEALARDRGRDLIGFYHSHPDHPAVPSEYDREHALPFFHYVVLAVASGEPREMASWVLSEDREVFDREEIVRIESRDEAPG